MLAETLDDNKRRAQVALRRSNYAHFAGDYLTAANIIQQAIEWAHLAEAYEIEVIAYIRWSSILRFQGDPADAHACSEKALSLVERIKDPDLLALSLLSLSASFMHNGDPENAQIYLKRALNLYHESGHKRNEPVILYNLAETIFYIDLAKAQEYYEQALHCWHIMGDRRFESLALSRLGNLIVERRRNYKKAKLYCEQAFRISVDGRDLLGEMSTFYSFAMINFVQNNYIAAQIQTKQALQICQEISYSLYHGICLTKLGALADQLGEYASALAYYAQGVPTLREAGDPDVLSQALITLGMTHYHLDDYHNTKQCYQEVLTITKKTKNALAQTHALVLQAHTHKTLSNLKMAAASYQQALALALDLGLQHYAKQAQTGLAAIAFAQRNLADAMAPMDEILDYLATQPRSTIDEAAWVYLTCYRILQAAGDRRDRPTLDAAYNFIQDIAVRIDDERLRASFLQNVRFNREIVAAWKGHNVI